MIASLRPIRPEDKDGLVQGLASLSLETRRRRFLSAKPRFTSAELRYLTEVDQHDHVAWVAEHEGRIVGVGRFVRLRESPDTAEFAIVVADDWQGQGVGRALAVTLRDQALRHGIRRFTATAFSDNVAVRNLLATIGERLEYRHDGAVDELVYGLAA